MTVTNKQRVQTMLEVMHVTATLDGMAMEHIVWVRNSL